MLLRRINQHIKDQHWFAVCIDFFIVVIGVFIGIQVANWNDERVAAANEAKLIVRLTEEMRVLESELAADAENYKSSVKATGALITALRSDAMPVDGESFRRTLWRANHFEDIPSLSASYSELVASGGLSRISNPELRAALIRYGDHFGRYDRLYSVGISTVLDPNSHYLRAVEWSADPELWNDPNTAIVSYDWNALQNTKGELQAWLAYQNDGERSIRNMHLEVQKIRSLLENR
jgi:hypothetical protein